MLGLKWSDIDFENGYIHIQRTATPKKGGYTFSDCKTEKSNRVLILPEVLTDKLLEWREIQKSFAPSEYDFVLLQQNGKILSATTLNKKYKLILSSCEIDTDTRFHDLRHSFASYLVNGNVPLPVISQMLGHSKISTTLDVYTHSETEQQKTALKALEKTLRGEKY